MTKLHKFTIIGLLSTVLLTGCGKFERITASITGWSDICINGVKYIQFTSGATVMYDQTGKIVTCQLPK